MSNAIINPILILRDFNPINEVISNRPISRERALQNQTIDFKIYSGQAVILGVRL